jgi:hypothetical protein
MAKRVSEEILKQAWIGDAVLALYARQRILAQQGTIDGPEAERLTSNQFLSGFAEPSHTEAEIGRVYQSQGLAAAFTWIETNLVPLFERQQLRRLKAAGKAIV